MEGLGVNLNLILQQVVVFVVFVYLFNKFLLDKILKIMEKRELKINDGLEYAEKMQTEYEKLAIKTSDEIEKARKESVKMIEETRTLASQVGNEIKEKAKTEAEGIIIQAKSQLDKDRIELKQTIKSEVAEILEVALQKIAIETTEESKKKSVEDAINSL